MMPACTTQQDPVFQKTRKWSLISKCPVFQLFSPYFKLMSVLRAGTVASSFISAKLWLGVQNVDCLGESPIWAHEKCVPCGHWLPEPPANSGSSGWRSCWVGYVLSDFYGSWISSLFIIVVFENKVSYSPGWTQNHCVVKESPELLTPLLLLPNCCYCRHARPSPVHLFTVNSCFFVGEVGYLIDHTHRWGFYLCT